MFCGALCDMFWVMCVLVFVVCCGLVCVGLGSVVLRFGCLVLCVVWLFGWVVWCLSWLVGGVLCDVVLFFVVVVVCWVSPSGCLAQLCVSWWRSLARMYVTAIFLVVFACCVAVGVFVYACVFLVSGCLCGCLCFFVPRGGCLFGLFPVFSVFV